MENITINVVSENKMSEECVKIWDDIAKRNTQAMYKLMEKTDEQRKNLKCTVEDIPNPFSTCSCFNN